jgi:hypothetical protein
MKQIFFDLPKTEKKNALYHLHDDHQQLTVADLGAASGG